MKTKIAIVDDHELMAKALSGLIQKFDNFDVIYEVFSGEQLIQRIRLGMVPEIVLLDINMPEMDGYTLTAKIKAMPGFERVPILALTANVMRGDKEKTLEAGCDGYIQKPLDIDQLIREIERFLPRRTHA